MKPVILAAVRPQGGVAVRRALGEYAEVVPVYAYSDAVSTLRARSGVDLVLCGVFFDETRAFDLLRFVRNERAALPFVACRIGGRAVAPVMVEAMASRPPAWAPRRSSTCRSSMPNPQPTANSGASCYATSEIGVRALF